MQLCRNLPRWLITCLPMQETWVWSLGWEDPLEKEMATHSSIPAWKIPWTQEPCGLQSLGSQSQTRLKRLSMKKIQEVGAEYKNFSFIYYITAHKSLQNQCMLSYHLFVFCSLFFFSWISMCNLSKWNNLSLYTLELSIILLMLLIFSNRSV